MTMEMSTINRVLGQRAGVLRLVFRLLPPRDLKNVVLVCRLWREVGEEPGLWAWGVTRLLYRGNMSNLVERLDCKRLRAVRELFVHSWGLEVTEEVVEAVTRHPGLRVVRMRNNSLYSVDPGLLGKMVKKLERVDMRTFLTGLTGQQLEAVMTALCESDSRLKKLAIGKLKFNKIVSVAITDNDLSSVDAGLLASALNMLEEVVMYRTELTKEQGEAIFTAIIEGNCNMKKLVISDNNLSTVDARAVNSLEEVVMDGTKLTVEQKKAILTHSLVKTSLRRLEMRRVRLMDNDLVARARLAIGKLLIR